MHQAHCNHALGFYRQQFRLPSVRLVLLSLVLSITAMVSVGVFSARIEAALQRDVLQALGGDIIIETKRNPSLAAWYGIIQAPQFQSLNKAQATEFPSVLQTDNAEVLVAIKAVSKTYPLKGQLQIKPLPVPSNSNISPQAFKHGPPQGEVWVDQAAIDALNLLDSSTIQTIRLGASTFKLTGIVVAEPDRGGGFINFAPRVLMNELDLSATQLLGPGSRATWRLYFAETTQAKSNATQFEASNSNQLKQGVFSTTSVLEQFQAELQAKLTPLDELKTLSQGRPEIYNTLQRASDFLTMASLMAALVAAVGMAVVSHAFAAEQSKQFALLKSMGYAPSLLQKRMLLGLLGLAILGAGLGLVFGGLAHLGLVSILHTLSPISLPWAGWHFMPIAFVLAMVLLLGFAAWPIAHALKTPAIAVLRAQDKTHGMLYYSIQFILGMVCAALLCIVLLSSLQLALSILFGIIMASLVFAAMLGITHKALSATLIRLYQYRRKPLPFWVLAFNTQGRLQWVQGIALCLGLTALLMLTVVQHNLLAQWQNTLPANAPNRFVFNIQPDQVAAVQGAMQPYVKTLRLYPMVRGRLVKHNQQPINPDNFEDGRTKNLLQRELNLSYTNTLPAHNQLVAGQWFTTASPHTSTLPEVSIEQSMAERLNIRLGDTLQFDIVGNPLQATVTSFRKLRWDSMEVNFFVIFPEATLKTFPQTWITAIHLPSQYASTVVKQWLQSFPNLTVVDTGAFIQQIRGILQQVALAVQFVFAFTIVAGGLVIMACIHADAPARKRTSAIARALGATNMQMLQHAWAQLLVTGFIAGTVASFVSQITGLVIANIILDLPFGMSNIDPLLWLLGPLIGMLVSLGFGARLVRQVSLQPVLRSLRAQA